MMVIGIAARSAEASACFYTNVFDLFPLLRPTRFVPPPALSTPEAEWVSLSCGENVALEIVERRSCPGWGGSINTLQTAGLNTLTFHTSDFDAALERVTRFGGVVCDGTVVELRPGARAAYVADPDGTPIEIQGGPGFESRFVHPVIVVRDLDRSERPYMSLGFQLTRSIDLSTPLDAVERLTRIKGVRMRGRVYRRGEEEIELLAMIDTEIQAAGGTDADCGLLYMGFETSAGDPAGQELTACGFALNATWKVKGRTLFGAHDAEGNMVTLIAD